ncbi:AAA family ATPase [Candidatus Tisiphia endosymbiont of Sialis lutaria]|uniref:AAA family ATPase n=1 Tax=Candidatus Tisiphia endosymbiont of Sialis lutaria TaxID=2029164 RepID=UPI00312C9287
MNNEVMQFFGLSKSFHQAAFLETECIKQNIKNIKAAIHAGGIVALTGMVGTGKTTLIWKIQQQLLEERQVVVCRSLATDKRRVNIAMLYTALFFDLAKDKNFKAPNQSEQRERKLLELVKKQDKPIALFIDEAHDLNSQTLISLKRLIELIYGSGGNLTVVLAGHPKLSNDLKRPSMEEIGARSQLFHLNHWMENKAYYSSWLFKQCCSSDVTQSEIITLEALELLVNNLVTPLQINHYLTQAMEQAYLAGTKPITLEIIQSVLTPDLDGIEAKLARYGYNIQVLCDVLNAKPSEVKAYLLGQLNNSNKLLEFNKEIYKLGVL